MICSGVISERSKPLECQGWRRSDTEGAEKEEAEVRFNARRHGSTQHGACRLHSKALLNAKLKPNHIVIFLDLPAGYLNFLFVDLREQGSQKHIYLLFTLNTGNVGPAVRC